MSKIIVIASGKGGVGKTTVTTNLGRALASSSSVLLVDGDFGLNNLDVALGVENSVQFDLFDVLNGKCRLKQALVKDQKEQSLYLLPSNKFYESTEVNSMQIKAVITTLAKKFEYVLIDAPAGVENGLAKILPCADEGYVVLTPDPCALRDADKVISTMKGYGIEKVSLVINRVRGDLILSQKSLSPEEISSVLQHEVISVIPESDNLLISKYESKKSALANKAFGYFAKSVKGEKSQLVDTTKRYRGFFGSIRRSLKGG